MLPEGLGAAIDRVVPPGVTHIGSVATNMSGEFLVTEPEGHPYSVTTTFSKVKVVTDEPASRTLGRCLREQVGHSPIAIYPIPSIWIGANSTSFYFAGLLGDIMKEECPVSPDICGLRRYGRDSAEQRIKVSKNTTSRERDLALLSTVATMCLSPYRRILLMVRELHLMGFERLRAPAYDYPLAWRCPVVPSAWTWKTHGGQFDDVPSDVEQFLGDKPRRHTYSSASNQQPFGWLDAAFLSPYELAL